MPRANATPAVYVVAPGGLRGRGGIGRMVAATAAHWRAADLQPRLRILDSYGAHLSPLTPLHLSRTLLEIHRGARRADVDLLHVHMAGRGSALRKGIVVRWAALHGLPLVLHLHGSRLDERYAALSAPLRRLLRQTLERADRIVVPGDYWRRVVIETIGIEGGRVRIIPNAVGGPAEVPTRAAGATIRLLFLGSLRREKGLHELLQALAGDALAALPWRLSIAGDGDARPFAEMATALGLAPRVAFLGWLGEADVHDLLASSDVFVLPSQNEGLSIALLEAMAHGCAVVTTPVGANAEAVTDGESGLLVPKGDPARLAAALSRVLTDAHLRHALQAGARRRWEAQFDIAEHCRKLIALYDELAK